MSQWVCRLGRSWFVARCGHSFLQNWSGIPRVVPLFPREAVGPQTSAWQAFRPPSRISLQHALLTMKGQK